MSLGFRTIVVDPPWEMRGFNGWGRRRPLPYVSMSVERIAALPVATVLRSEGYLLLWATSSHLGHAFDVLDAWGLTYRQPITWCKEECSIGLGGILASSTEHVLVAQKIRPGTNAHGARTRGRRAERNWFTWPRTEHSAKPEGFYRLVEKLLPGPRLDVFARERRDGWTTIGNEIDGRDVTDALSKLQTGARQRTETCR